MSVDYSVLPLSKGKTRKQLKDKKDRADTNSLKAWRDRAWSYQPGGHDIPQWGLCGDCGRHVRRVSGQFFGHVHHIISRRHKDTRTADSNAVILCRNCHNKRHGREF